MHALTPTPAPLNLLSIADNAAYLTHALGQEQHCHLCRPHSCLCGLL